ncbi:MAG: ATP-binding cassette domain-containing protein [Planctomycetes bacterium]|nr:ATP-binding cassette domain-containing protein [Planctomycetota bacterium]
MSDAVAFSGVSYTTAEGETLLSGLDFALAPGESLVIAGGGSSGKSSALALCVGGYAPTSGSVAVLGEDPSALDVRALDRLRLRVGYVPQRGGLLSNLDLRDNISLPLRYHRGADGSTAARAVERVHTLLDVEPLPALMPADAPLLMRQVAAIARALVLGPELLLIDEPGSGLDEADAEELWRLLWRVQSETGIAILATTADAAAAQPLTTRVLHLTGRRQVTFRLRPG